MLVMVKERCFVNNRLYEAGQVFDYDGPLPPRGVGPLVVQDEEPAAEPVRQSRAPRGRVRKGSAAPEWTSEGQQTTAE